MFEEIKSITNFDDQAMRNIIALKLGKSLFDDLSDDPLDWEVAESSVTFENRFTRSELEFNVIDYIFERRFHSETRFSDGSFPVWYASLDLETTFYETVYHWKKFLNQTPDLINSKNSDPIYCSRSVFTTECHSSLVDLRGQIKNHPSLVSKESYQDTQSIGLKLAKEGFPGIVTKSARRASGTNLAIFNKSVLKSPSLFGDYIYAITPENPSIVEVQKYKNRNVLCTINT